MGGFVGYLSCSELIYTCSEWLTKDKWNHARR